MSKFVIDFDGLVPKTIEPIEQALEEAYQRGINDGNLDVKERVDCAYQNGYNEAWVSVGECEDRVAKQAYQKGLDDAWKLAQKVVLLKTGDGDGFSSNELNEIFGYSSPHTVLSIYSATEAVSKLCEHEEKQNANEIKVGDEVMNTTYGTLNGITGFYTGRTNGGKYRILQNVCGCIFWALWESKIGRASCRERV